MCTSCVTRRILSESFPFFLIESWEFAFPPGLSCSRRNIIIPLSNRTPIPNFISLLFIADRYTQEDLGLVIRISRAFLLPVLIRRTLKSTERLTKIVIAELSFNVVSSFQHAACCETCCRETRRKGEEMRDELAFADEVAEVRVVDKRVKLYFVPYRQYHK